MNRLTGIIIDGKAYEAIPELREKACSSCDLDANIGCIYVDICLDKACIFRFSQELTDKINGNGTNAI